MPFGAFLIKCSMREIGIDIETYSPVDLAKCGVYRYAEHPEFAVLLFSYCVDGGAVHCVDFARGEALPVDIQSALYSPAVIKTAYNATFERVCLSRWFHRAMDPAQWRCTMVRAARLGLPMGLAKCADVLGLEKGKMKEGAALIRKFSCAPRQMPDDDPEAWELFKRYNMRDVEVEQEILRKVRCIAVPEWEERLYAADQRINDRGVLVDGTLARNAVRICDAARAELTETMQRITRLDNPGSPVQLKEWLERRTGIKVESLAKKGGEIDAARFAAWPDVQRVLECRAGLAKTSCAKYGAMLQCMCGDGRVHGLLQFYGTRTGRWAGRLVQLQNLPQNHLDDIDTARQRARDCSPKEFAEIYPEVQQTLSELIRTAFIAPAGYALHVCDFSAIEARVIAWIAGEKWALEAFSAGRDIYCETASRMFGVPVEKHGQNAELRAKGKIAVLALGYGGGPNALEAIGGARMGLTYDEEHDIVQRWRVANGRIVKLWAIVEAAVSAAVRTGEAIEINRGIRIAYKYNMLVITLPSGRSLVYPRPTVDMEARGYASRWLITYEGMDQTTQKWGRIRTYGGKLVENIVQAVARDILGHVLLRAEAEGQRVVFHVHDEIIAEAPKGQPLERVERLFSEAPEWAKGLPLTGAGYATPYYLKD